MEFIVSRVSDDFNTKKPCEEAYKKHIPHIAEYNFSSFEEYDAKWGRKYKFTDTDINHRINERGNIEKELTDFSEDVWVVQINTLEELLAFRNKYGSIIVGESGKNHYYDEITIYDYW